MTNELENTMRAAERHLRTRQVCVYWKIPNDIRLTSESELIFGDTGPCDFMGHTVDGTALLIEAKMCKGPRLAVPSKSGIRGHQWMALRDCHAAGGHAIIAWQRESEVAVLTWNRASNLLGSRRSIPWPAAFATSLEHDEPALVVVAALVNVLELRAKRLH